MLYVERVCMLVCMLYVERVCMLVCMLYVERVCMFCVLSNQGLSLFLSYEDWRIDFECSILRFCAYGCVHRRCVYVTYVNMWMHSTVCVSHVCCHACTTAHLLEGVYESTYVCMLTRMHNLCMQALMKCSHDLCMRARMKCSHNLCIQACMKCSHNLYIQACIKCMHSFDISMHADGDVISS
jgi:hypothetical protein